MKKILIMVLVITTMLLISACGDFNYGVVKNTEGETVENAIIEINDKEIKTNENGYFVIKDLPPGEYTMKIEKEGYKEKEIEFEIDDKSRDKGDVVLEKK